MHRFQVGNRNSINCEFGNNHRAITWCISEVSARLVSKLYMFVYKLQRSLTVLYGLNIMYAKALTSQEDQQTSTNDQESLLPVSATCSSTVVLFISSNNQVSPLHAAVRVCVCSVGNSWQYIMDMPTSIIEQRKTCFSYNSVCQNHS